MAQRHPLQILVAEDNPINQKVIRLMLERLSYRPDIVGNGLEAIQALYLRPYDLVLMDMQMLGLDGLSTTCCIRAELPSQAQPRIVALTANALVESRQEAAGVDDYLTKPLECSALLRVLQGSLPKSRLPSPVSLAPAVKAAADVDTASDAIDAATFNALKAGIGPEGQAVLQEMIKTYLQEGQAQIGSLQKALTQQDPQALFRLAHRFKGSSSTLGAKGLARLCQEMESLTRTEPIDWDLMESLLNQ
ncbi:MAG: Hpt domain-containing protein [Cyanobacteriota bacterium]